MSKIIPRNTCIPTKKTQVFTTTTDNQTTVAIQVYEGERPIVKENHFLGRFDLAGIPPAPNGIPTIEVTFELDINGILTITAKDTGTGNQKKIIINSNQSHLSQKEINKMIADAERFSDQDKKVQERIEAKNDLESYAYILKTKLANKKNLFENLSSEDAMTIKKYIEEQITWLELNPDATTSQLKIHKSYLEDIVTSVMDKAETGSDGLHQPPRSSHQNKNDL
ncbi:unnamed protein product [Rotaria magnacalcarata]|uniref:Heat shock protein 70 n=1 Tax=Rotaria magnacalcarata TaxID=392030 RepID=A0A820JTU0_9BILA|nr:unnamed protein product [Rotaria magnacalcarata]CAF4329249.1 unnamed protein product [Rotaria magnacalcarata]